MRNARTQRGRFLIPPVEATKQRSVKPAFALIRVHRNGVLDYHEMLARPGFVDGPEVLSELWPQPVYRYLLDVFSAFAGLYRHVGYFGPLAIRGFYTHIEGIGLPTGSHRGSSSVVGEPTRFVGYSSVESLRQDGPTIAREILDRVWQAGGVQRCPWFTPEGELIDSP